MSLNVFPINKIHYTTVELFKFKSLSMHLNKIHELHALPCLSASGKAINSMVLT